MGKMLFTASQWKEFESQTMIYKYMIASIPVPPQLLLPLSVQSNRSGTDLRFSNGSDPEPWRCRRTDGKKWRCSKDAMPDQRYCDRHAHKNRPRSRKHVETQSHNTKLPSNPLRNNHNYHPILPPAPSMPPTTSCQQSRFMKSDAIPLSSLNQKIQKPMVSPSVGSKRDHFCHQDLEGNHQDDCSLALSMQSGGNDVSEDQDFFQMGIGMLNADGSNPPNQWVNQGSWLGGPLGEALCLGIASTQKQPPNVSSLNGHSNQE
ncbi:Glutamine-Leucine-Glutamine, QLQ [Cynara cardunculus var. scolymus]|uniref:Growth-regulating factor n=2 Tax=Cynara cardunculus var. scolymus TaxID=59895 RepID=A0A118JSK4_CYNCS|nr:Glutamine-Leucine-Glutamine, QLQ [Cynara cardunculus var. scolymus]